MSIETKNIKIDTNSPIPIYFQIEKIIGEKILSGEFKEGDKIPTEMELTESLKVSRPTIRQAMVNLKRAGLIEVKRGSGTFVKTKDFEEPVLGIRSYTDEAIKKGYTPLTKILSIKIIKPDLELKEIMQLIDNQTVTEIKRLRYLDNEPTAIDVSYIPSRFVPNISKGDFKEIGQEQSLYNLLKTKYGLILSHGEETIDSTIVNLDEAKLLLMKDKSPINLRRRLVYTQKDELVLYMRAIYKTRYRIKLEGPF